MFNRTPSHRLGSILLPGIALSIGWGIRGNFGHEVGAMMPGALAAIAICLLSGREDWRERVAHFAFFGSIGWGFGGSISYMHSVSYTHSGDSPTQLYGFGANFLIGFLWAGLGGAGMALAATMPRERLNALFRPILFVLAGWAVLDLFYNPVFEGLGHFMAHRTGADSTLVVDRHEQALYWLDSDWISALMVLGMACLYDLWQRREPNSLLLPLFAGLGAFLGWGVQWILDAVGVSGKIGSALTVPLGLPGQVTLDGSVPDPASFVTNWPNLFVNAPWQIGWIAGLLLGVFVYFCLYGRFRDGASLFVYLAGGWFICFLMVAIPGNIFFHDIGGLSLTPPRNDNWAGVLGVFLGGFLWFCRNRLQPVAFASVLAGVAGGCAFVCALLTRLLLVRIGSGFVQIPEAQAALRAAPVEQVKAQVAAVRSAADAIATDTGWLHYQSANWHSIYEQTAGLYHGIALALVFAFLARRLPPPDEWGAPARWTRAFCVFFIVIVLTYLNLMKNVSQWASQLKWLETDPTWSMTPLPEWFALTPQGWFNVLYLAVGITFVILIRRHLQGAISIVPVSPLGRGQLLFVLFLWIITIGNCERALVAFTENRLITEVVIWLNACLATALVLLLPRERDVPEIPRTPYRPPWIRMALGGALASCLVVYGVWWTTRQVYGDKYAGHSGWQHRMGPYAEWKINPTIKSHEHP